MNKQQLIKKIVQKKEFSQLPKKDVEMAFSKFDKDIYGDDEKVKLTRDLLRKVFSAFTSQKLLSLKNKDAGWVLKKHLSTRERLPYYEELYKKLLRDFDEINIFDLGCGANGFSYKYLESLNKDFNYIGIEAIGQIVGLANNYFRKNKITGKVVHLSLFELEKIKRCINQVKGEKIIFLFKVIDSLEMLERDYSKKLLKEIVLLVDRVVVSFATRSLASRRRFKVKRSWIVDYIKENFNILDEFEFGGEKYLVFKQQQNL